MGSGRDKRKKSKPKKPGQGADKTLRKTEANEEKATRRTERKTKAGAVSIEPVTCSSTGTSISCRDRDK